MGENLPLPLDVEAERDVARRAEVNFDVGLSNAGYVHGGKDSATVERAYTLAMLRVCYRRLGDPVSIEDVEPGFFDAEGAAVSILFWRCGRARHLNLGWWGSCRRRHAERE